jgi:hypothetical protein
MADRIPLIVDSSTKQIKELPTNDNLDLSSSNIVGVTSVGIGTTSPSASLDVVGDVKISGDIELSGSITSAELESYELDDISFLTDGTKNTFPLTFNYQSVNITNPFRLLVTVNGIIQSAFINNLEHPSLLGLTDGYTIDYDGNIKFSESLPSATKVVIRVIPGSVTQTKIKYYPLSPSSILLGS